MSGQMNVLLERSERSLAAIFDSLSTHNGMSPAQISRIYDEAVVVLLRWLILHTALENQWLAQEFEDEQAFRTLCVQVISTSSMSSFPLLQGGLFEPSLTHVLSNVQIDSEQISAAMEYLFDPTDASLTVSPNDLSALFQMLLEREVVKTSKGWVVQQKFASKRKGTGAFYTPDILVASVLDSTVERLIEGILSHYSGDEATSRLLALRVCEPSCGAGTFLVATVRRITEALHDCSTNNTLSLQDWKRQVATHCVYGVDINPIAIALCQYALWVEVGDVSLPVSTFESHVQCGNALLWSRSELVQTGIDASHFDLVSGDVPHIRNQITKRCRQESRRHIWTWTEHHLLSETVQDIWLASLFWPKIDEAMVKTAPTLSVLSDALTTGVDELVWSAIQTVRDGQGFFQWESRFPEVMTDGGFDAVIGNPPYLASRYLSKHHPYLRKALPKMYASASGNWDIYIPFTELAFYLLKEGGFQAFVTPNKIIGAEYASVLQTQFFFQYTMLEVHDFTRLNLFDGANVSVVVVVNQKIPSPSEHRTSFVQYQDDWTVSRRQTISIDALRSLPKGFISFPLTIPDTGMIKWLAHSIRLSDVCTISDGMSTDQAYRIQPFVRSGNPEDWSCTKSIKLVNTGTIDPFRLKWGEQELSFLGYKGRYPILDASHLREHHPRRYQQAEHITVAIAGLSNRIEAAVLPKGVMSGVATVLLQPNEGVCPYALTALLNSQVYSDLYKGLFGMSGMTADILNYSSKPMGYLPIPGGLERYSSEGRLSKLGQQLHDSSQLTTLDNTEVWNELACVVLELLNQ